MFRKILIAAAALIAVLAAVVALQPSEYRVERTIAIAAPSEAVFAQINDLHKWEAWSPWAQKDPDAKTSFEGPEAGAGAIFNWSGNDEVGEGRMTIVESVPNEGIKVKVDFVRPFTGTSTTEFDLTPAVDHTAITWIMSGERDFVSKAMCLFMDTSAMLGGEMDKGLAQMKSLIESQREAENPA